MRGLSRVRQRPRQGQSDELVGHFGRRSETTRCALGALFPALELAASTEVDRAFGIWQNAFFATSAQKHSTGRLCKTRELFSIHTYYALVVKLVASFVARRFPGGSGSEPEATTEGHRGAFVEIERGVVFRERGIDNFIDVEGDCFGWYTSAWNAEIEAALGEVARRVGSYVDGTLLREPHEPRDRLKELYEDLVPREVRHELGEYYTPDWLATRLLVQTTGEADLGNPERSVLDPACGSGTFLVTAINQIKRRAAVEQYDGGATLSAIVRNVAGLDINPLAVLSARTNYLLALEGLLDERSGNIEIPVYLRDSIIESTSEVVGSSYDYVIGNPPWVNWEHLPDEYRRATEGLWRQYGLFPKRRKGFSTILGSAKYDVSMLMTYVSIDRYLRPGGRLGFVLPQNLFKSVGAGQGFRRFCLPDGTAFAPLYVEDLSGLKPFGGAVNRTATAVFVKGQQVCYPVSYHICTRGRTDAEIRRTRQWAEPIDPDDPASAWLTARPKCLPALRKLSGRSGYVARKGVTAGINGVFWLRVHGAGSDGDVSISNATERSKKAVESIQTVIEDSLLYPLVRGRDVSRWSARTELSLLLTHKAGMRLRALPEEEMQREYPKTWKYLTRFESGLRQSGIFRRYFKPSDPFYSVFNVGDYTFAANKVVVREIASSLTAAVIEKEGERPWIPDHKLVLVDCESADEAHYLCALLNSRPARLFVDSYSLNTQFSTHIFDQLAVPRFSGAPLHNALAKCSREAHRAVATGDEASVSELEDAIDCWAAELWELSGEELAEMQCSAEL